MGFPRIVRTLLLTVFGWLVAVGMSAQSSPRPAAPMPLDDIVRNLDASNRDRAEALRQYEATRTYAMQYHGFPSGHAEMVVRVRFQAPATKQFHIVSQSGSHVIVDRVFKPMMDREREGASDPARVETTSRNYQFSMAGYERTPDGDRYVLYAKPRTDDRLLFRGKVWIDAKEFAVVRIEGEPAESPSFWIKRTEIRHSYKKVNGFWLPSENRSTSYMRFGGRADLSIEYQKYDITDAHSLPQARASEGTEQHAIEVTP
jgi:hypothetical protein